ncbi:hypothetical protein FE257_005440 [Aspergillus nanangensis]|uniref:RelA/SpoT domain-containing protein n=1 Tax=Aspergillus nanangensis TaxID=2582783 RepID=A0AAD4GUQ3_ASPNN|nr:hypothetical protein FE257_005440 [Aspergillus nanangensis]
MGSEVNMETKVIQEFLEQWSIDSSVYTDLKNRTVDICKAAICKGNVKGIVHGRIKEPDSLKAKLHARQKVRGRPYEDLKDIRKDIVDLAGVRIAINYPLQKDTVGDIIRESFDVVETRNIFDTDDNMKATSPCSTDPTQGSPQWGVYSGTFPGYCADHYRVHLKRKDIPQGVMWYGGLIEIQVVSKLRDAWATAGHDTIYKNLSLASETERYILNGLSMIIWLGECFSNQLYESRENNEPFQDFHELAIYLRRWMKDMAHWKSEELGEVSLLWQLLKIMEMNIPNTLHDSLKTMDFSQHERGGYQTLAREYEPLQMTIVDYVMDRIVGSPSGEARIASRLQAGQHEATYKVRVLVDSLVFLDQLSISHYRWVKFMMNTDDQEIWNDRAQNIRWLVTDEPRQVVDDHEALSLKGCQRIESLWSYFETHPWRPVKLVFGLSRLEVVKTRHADWPRLTAAVKGI